MLSHCENYCYDLLQKFCMSVMVSPLMDSVRGLNASKYEATNDTLCSGEPASYNNFPSQAYFANETTRSIFKTMTTNEYQVSSCSYKQRVL